MSDASLKGAASDIGGRRSPDHAALLARVALGDRAAFRELYDATSARLLGVILRIQPDRGRAEDLLQEVFVKVWAGAGGYQAQRAQAMTWLTSIARYAAIDSLRRQQADPVAATRPGLAEPAEPGEPDEPLALELALAQAPEPGPGPAELMQQALEAQAVRACLGELSHPQRQSLALAFYDGLSHGEVASQLGQPLGTVKSWLRRGLQALQRCLEGLGLAEPMRS